MDDDILDDLEPSKDDSKNKENKKSLIDESQDDPLSNDDFSEESPLDDIIDEIEDPLSDFDKSSSTENFDLPEIDDDPSAVSTSPSRNILLIGVLLAFAVYMLYDLIFSSNDQITDNSLINNPQVEEPINDNARTITNDMDSNFDDFAQIETPDISKISGFETDAPAPELPTIDTTINPDSLPQIPQANNEPARPAEIANIPQAPQPAPVTEIPKPQEPVNPAPIVETPPSISEEEMLAAKLRKRRSSMLLINGGGTPDKEADPLVARGILTSKDVTQTSAEQVKATKIGATDYIVGQGKILHAVLETAINTDLTGILRASISRDIYGESGRNILIPKGSRLIGDYNSGISRGQTRVLITWKRLILPNGQDFSFDSPGVDQIGRAGARGFVDNKYFEIFKNSLLVSAITIGGAVAIDSVRDSQRVTSSTTNNNDGSTTSSTSADATDLATLDSVDDISDIATDIASDLINSQPTIYIDQGTIINVFVNQDLIFPADNLSDGIKIIN